MKKYLLLALVCFGLMAPLSQAQTTADSMTEIAAGRDMELLKTQVAFYHALATMEENTGVKMGTAIGNQMTSGYEKSPELETAVKDLFRFVLSLAEVSLEDED